MPKVPRRLSSTLTIGLARSFGMCGRAVDGNIDVSGAYALSSRCSGPQPEPIDSDTGKHKCDRDPQRQLSTRAPWKTPVSVRPSNKGMIESSGIGAQPKTESRPKGALASVQAAFVETEGGGKNGFLVVVVPERVARTNRGNVNRSIGWRRRRYRPLQRDGIPGRVSGQSTCAQTRDEVNDAQEDAKVEDQGPPP